MLGEEDGGEACLACAGGAPDGDPVRLADPRVQGGGPGALEVGGPALAGEAAVTLGDAGVGLGEPAQGLLCFVAGMAEAVFGKCGEGDLLFAAAGAVPEGHCLALSLAMM